MEDTRRRLQERVVSVSDCLRRCSDNPPHHSPDLFALSSSSAPVPSLDDVAAAYAPLGLCSPFRELYRILRPALVPRSQNNDSQDTVNAAAEQHKSVSAFLQGDRGSGKSLLLKRVLQAIDDEAKQRYFHSIGIKDEADMDDNVAPKAYRMVYVHGILVPGFSVTTVVRDVLQQLSDAALDAGSSNRVTTSAQSSYKRRKPSGDTNEPLTPTRTKRTTESSSMDSTPTKKTVDDVAQGMLRIKQISFTNQMQLLSEILKIASVDGIPVLFVLDELDTFLGRQSGASGSGSHASKTGTPDRQLLLYHLLERIATTGSLCSLVGITSDTGITARLEKRIKSRAEGTAKFVLTKPCASLVDVANILFECCCSESNKSARDERANESDRQLRKDAESIFLPVANRSDKPSQQERVQEALQRDFYFGRHIRWFKRVLYEAMALYKFDLQHLQRKTRSSASTNLMVPTFHARYIEEALVDMGGSIVPPSASGTASMGVAASDFCVQALIDLSGPQIALLLAARRIMVRENGSNSSQRNNNKKREVQPQLMQLTLSRMLHEYQSSFKAGGSYSNSILRLAFYDLVEIGLLRAASDHTGLGPFQFRFRDDALFHSNTTADVVDRIPLHLTVDVHRQLKQALDGDIFNCSIALKEWGKKTN